MRRITHAAPPQPGGDIIEGMASRLSMLTFLLACSAAALGDGEVPISRTVIGGANESLLAAADALRVGDAETAIRLSLQGLDDAMSANDRAGALSNLCAAYTLAGEYDLAIARCTDALATDERWHAYHNRALAYLHKHQLDEAARDIDAGLALFPESRLLAKARAALEEMRHERPPPVIKIASV